VSSGVSYNPEEGGGGVTHGRGNVIYPKIGGAKKNCEEPKRGRGRRAGAGKFANYKGEGRGNSKSGVGLSTVSRL